CAAEARLVAGIEVYPVAHLAEVLRALDGTQPLVPSTEPGVSIDVSGPDCDFSEVRGQTQARRAIEIAVAGGHSILLYGPPGLGKTMLARRAPTILPPLRQEEAIEVTRIYSAAGQLPRAGR